MPQTLRETAQTCYLTHSHTAVTYPDMITELNDGCAGREKATTLLHILNKMKRDKIEFFDLFQKVLCPELQTSLRGEAPLVSMCHDHKNGTYFYPDERGKNILETFSRNTCNEAWSQALQRVALLSMSQRYAVAGRQPR